MYELYNDERTIDLHTGDDTNVYDYFMQLCTHWWWAGDAPNMWDLHAYENITVISVKCVYLLIHTVTIVSQCPEWKM